MRGVCIAVGMHAYCQGLGSTRAHACHTPAHAHMHNAYIHTCIHTPKRYTQLSAKATSIQGKASCFLLYKATEDGGGVVEIVDLTRRQRGVVGGPGVEFMGRKIKSTEDPSAWAMVRLFPSFGSARFFSRSFFFFGGGVQRGDTWLLLLPLFFPAAHRPLLVFLYAVLAAHRPLLVFLHAVLAAHRPLLVFLYAVLERRGGARGMGRPHDRGALHLH